MSYKLDKKGFIINEGNKNKIQKKYLPSFKKISSFLIKELGKNLVSIYLRGSGSTGEVIPNISDLDVIVITNKNILKKKLIYFSKVFKKIEKEYIQDVELEVTIVSLKDFYKSQRYKNLRIYIKTRSVLLYGSDVVKKISKIRVGKELSLEIYQDIKKEINHLRKIFLGKIKNPSYLNESRPIKFWCVWTMRTLLRFGLGIVMLDDKIYTSDLKDCYKIFSKKYPQYKKEMKKALYLSVNPTSDKNFLVNYLETFGKNLFYLWEAKIMENQGFNEKAYSKIGIEGTYVSGFKFIRNLLRNLKTKKVLDYGSGAGRSSVFLKSLGAEVFAVDISEKMVALGNKINRDIPFKLIKNKKIPYGNNTFDIVFSSFVHVGISSISKMTRLNKEIFRVVKKNGELIILTINPQMWGKDYISTTSIFPKEFRGISGDKVEVILKQNPPMRFFDYYWEKSDYQKSLLDSGFNKIKFFIPKSTEKTKTPPYLIIVVKKY